MVDIKKTEEDSDENEQGGYSSPVGGTHETKHSEEEKRVAEGPGEMPESYGNEPD